MSYAEQFYGMMGNQALLYADNLAWFGTESYVYKSADLMMKVIQNPVAMSNKVAAFYAYLWARAKGMKASDYFEKGTEISFYNTDLGRSFEAKIIAFNEDGSATFVSTQAWFFMPLSDKTKGTNVINVEDYFITQMMNGGLNWYSQWKSATGNQEATNIEDNSGNGKMLRKYLNRAGFFHGLEYDFQKRLVAYKMTNVPIYFHPLDTETAKNLDAKTRAGMMRINKDVYDDVMEEMGAEFHNFALNGYYWSALFEQVGEVADDAYHNMRGCMPSSSFVYDRNYAIENKMTGSYFALISGLSTCNFTFMM